MYYFSYNDYMDYTNNKKVENIKKINYLEEEKENYVRIDEVLEKEQIKIKESLKNKSKILKFLNSYLKLSDPIEKNNLEDCSNIIQKEKESFLYKIKGKEIYIFIKISNAKDNNLIYKIFNLAMEIINYWNNNMMKKSLRYPIVIPIVIYTGNEDWQENYDFSKYINYENNGIYLHYNLIKAKQFIKYLD